jgi:tetratricopeptide (TPR) repeat protein
MTGRKSPQVTLILACLCGLAFNCASLAQTPSDAIHTVEVQLRARGASVSGVRVRLVRQSRMLPVSDTFSRQEGQIRFTNLLPGDYIVETIESERFEATATRVSIIPVDFRKPTRANVTIDLPARKQPDTAAPGVVMADVDLNVPEAALKHYRRGLEALRAEKTEEAAKAFKAAVEAYPKFYSARLELGRQLRAQKRFSEAEAALRPLGEIAPKHAESLVEHAIVLLALGKQKEAAAELRKALLLEEANWVTHLHLGWALLADQPAQAERHFTRALELDERKAAQAHLSLARLAYAKGMRPEAIRHLEAYLALAPDAPDASAVQKLLNQLRK